MKLNIVITLLIVIVMLAGMFLVRQNQRDKEQREAAEKLRPKPLRSRPNRPKRLWRLSA